MRRSLCLTHIPRQQPGTMPILQPQTAGITAEPRGRGWAPAPLCSGWQPGRGWLRNCTAHYSSGHSWASSRYSLGWVGCGAGGFLWTSNPPPPALLQFCSPPATPSIKHFFDEKKRKARAWWAPERTLTRLQGRKSSHSNPTYTGLSQTGWSIYESKDCMNKSYL